MSDSIPKQTQRARKIVEKKTDASSPVFDAWFVKSGLNQEHKAVAKAGWAAHKRHVRSPQKWKTHPAVRHRFKRWQKSANDKSRQSADYHCRRWDEIEEALVMDETKTITWLSKHLGRTRHAVKSKRKILNKLNNSPA